MKRLKFLTCLSLSFFLIFAQVGCGPGTVEKTDPTDTPDGGDPAATDGGDPADEGAKDGDAAPPGAA